MQRAHPLTSPVLLSTSAQAPDESVLVIYDTLSQGTPSLVAALRSRLAS